MKTYKVTHSASGKEYEIVLLISGDGTDAAMDAHRQHTGVEPALADVLEYHPLIVLIDGEIYSVESI